MARILFSRADLEGVYPGYSMEGFRPSHRVEVLDPRTQEILREDFVELREEGEHGIRFAFNPVGTEPVYAFIPPKRWQALECHGRVKARPIRYVADYVRLSERDGFVYFIQSGSDGPIKIGWSEDVNRRVAELQTANAHSLRVIGKIPGTLRDEANMHARFAHLRMEAEWFRAASEIFDFLAESSAVPVE